MTLKFVDAANFPNEDGQFFNDPSLRMILQLVSEELDATTKVHETLKDHEIDISSCKHHIESKPDPSSTPAEAMHFIFENIHEYKECIRALLEQH